MSEIPKAKRNYLKITGSILSVIIGIGIAYFGSLSVNYIFMLVGIIFIGSGVYFTYRFWKNDTTFVKHNKNNIAVNCFNLYPDKIAFEYMNEKDLKGNLMQCTNDGKYYYVHQYSRVSRELEELKLPDAEHGDNPREIGDVLQSDVIRRCLAYVPTDRAQVISMAVAVGIIAIELIALVIIE